MLSSLYFFFSFSLFVSFNPSLFTSHFDAALTLVVKPNKTPKTKTSSTNARHSAIVTGVTPAPNDVNDTSIYFADEDNASPEKTGTAYTWAVTGHVLVGDPACDYIVDFWRPQFPVLPGMPPGKEIGIRIPSPAPFMYSQGIFCKKIEPPGGGPGGFVVCGFWVVHCRCPFARRKTC